MSLPGHPLVSVDRDHPAVICLSDPDALWLITVVAVKALVTPMSDRGDASSSSSVAEVGLIEDSPVRGLITGRGQSRGRGSAPSDRRLRPVRVPRQALLKWHPTEANAAPRLGPRLTRGRSENHRRLAQGADGM